MAGSGSVGNFTQYKVASKSFSVVMDFKREKLNLYFFLPAFFLDSHLLFFAVEDDIMASTYFQATLYCVKFPAEHDPAIRKIQKI